MTVPVTQLRSGHRAHPLRTLLILESPALDPLPFPAEGYSAVRIAGWERLLAAVRREPPSTAVLVAPFRPPARDPDPALRELMAAAPLLPVLVCLDFERCSPEGAETVLRWGASEVVDLRLELASEALVPRFRAAHARPFKRRLEGGLSRHASGNALTLIRAAVEVASDGGLSTSLAGVFGVNERTVGDWCAREGLPPPRRLLAWIRVLLAAALLEESGRSWSNVARSSGYADDPGLRRAVKGLLRRPPSSPRERPEFTAALAAFESELRECRERARTPPRR